MIKKNGSRVELQFGNGDIRMAGVATNDGEVGYVAFENQNPPGIIGKNPLYVNDKFLPENYPVIMSFTKVESIDALIGELVYAKENMIKGKKIKEVIINGK